MNEFEIPSDTIRKWLTGWSLSRKLPLPVAFKSGFKVDVGYDTQVARYVFPEINDDFIQLSQTIKDPWIFLKVCASRNKVVRAVSATWKIQPIGYMMICNSSMQINKSELRDDYKLKYETYDSVHKIQVLNQEGQVASIGHLILVDDLAVYDRISTGTDYKRKGLASCIMNELEKIAISKGIFKNILVATEEGKLFYESLGWNLYCPYTSIVIPE